MFVPPYFYGGPLIDLSGGHTPGIQGAGIGGGTGTVTQVNTGAGLTGGPITTTGTVSLNAVLNDLNDVVISTPTSTQFLRYNGTNWENQTVTLNSGTVTSVTAGTGLSGGTITAAGTIALNAILDQLNDVVITSPTSNQVLTFNGTNWVNQAVGGGSVTLVNTGTGLTGGPITSTGTISLNANLDALTDVIVGSPINGQTLVYDGFSGLWVNAFNNPISVQGPLNATNADLPDTKWVSKIVGDAETIAIGNSNPTLNDDWFYIWNNGPAQDQWVRKIGWTSMANIDRFLFREMQNANSPVFDFAFNNLWGTSFIPITEPVLFWTGPNAAYNNSLGYAKVNVDASSPKVNTYGVRLTLRNLQDILNGGDGTGFAPRAPIAFGALQNSAVSNTPTNKELVFYNGTNWINKRLTFADVTDSNVSPTPSTNDFIGFDGTNWVNRTAVYSITAGTGLSGGTITATGTIALNAILDQLNDVVITSPASNQVLTFDGTNWVNAAPPMGGGGTVTSVATGTGLTGGPITTTGTISLNAVLDDLNDVVISTPSSNQFLRYNGTQWVNQTVTLNSGTVTSITAGTGLSGGTITTSGTIALSAALNNLTDVLITSPSNNQFLRYDSGTSKWVNQTFSPVTSITAGTGLSGGTITTTGTIALNAVLDDLNDVVISTPASNQFLRYNGTQWVNQTVTLNSGTVTSITAGTGLSGGTITTTGTIALNAVLDDLNDVVISTPSSNQFLRYNGTNWVNQTVTLNSGTVTSVTAGTGLSGGTITTTGTIALNAILDNLNDVIITTPASNHFLRYDGTNWVNIIPSLNNLSDVVIVSPATNHVIKYAVGAFTNAPQYLGEHGDVDLTTVVLTNNQVLKYNAGLSRWVNSDISLQSNILTDTVITSPTNNQFLRYNGSQWVNQTVTLNSGTVTSITAGTGLSGGTITTAGTISLNANLDALTDVVITSPATNQVIQYNGTNWVNQTITTSSGTVQFMPNYTVSTTPWFVSTGGINDSVNSRVENGNTPLALDYFGGASLWQYYDGVHPSIVGSPQYGTIDLGTGGAAAAGVRLRLTGYILWINNFNTLTQLVNSFIFVRSTDTLTDFTPMSGTDYNTFPYQAGNTNLPGEDGRFSWRGEPTWTLQSGTKNTSAIHVDLGSPSRRYLQIGFYSGTLFGQQTTTVSRRTQIGWTNATGRPTTVNGFHFGDQAGFVYGEGTSGNQSPNAFQFTLTWSR